MSTITREHLQCYLDEALSDAETAQIEEALRHSEPLRRQLQVVMQERDRGEHSIGAIWRRRRLSCPTREQLGSHLLKALDADLEEYVEFHLKTVSCAICLANLADLQALHEDSTPSVQARRRRFFESSAGLLPGGRNKR